MTERINQKEGLRSLVYRQLYSDAWRGSGLSPVNKLIITLIFLSVILVVVETEQTLLPQWGGLFSALDTIVGALFAIEYGARLWSVGENPDYRGLVGRLRYMSTPMAIIDLLVVVPFFLGVVRSHIFMFRIARIFRLLALARFGRYSLALSCLGAAIARRKHELAISMLLQGAVLIAASTVMYFVEGKVQPQAFGSIPRALWWGVITLTSVGYGDVHPITVVGKICCGITALAGIALIALPTGILAAAFSDAFQKRSALVDGNSLTDLAEEARILEHTLMQSGLEQDGDRVALPVESEV